MIFDRILVSLESWFKQHPTESTYHLEELKDDTCDLDCEF